jgi:polyferredoxin
MKKRQHIRSGLIILSLLLFPITQFYFSPYLVVWGASQGIITASFFTFAFMLFGAFFIGRAFCGWVMPCAGMQEMFFLINKKKPKTGKLGYIKFALWFPWLLAIMVLVLCAGGYKNVEYFFHLEHGISVSNVYVYSVL